MDLADITFSDFDIFIFYLFAFIISASANFLAKNGLFAKIIAELNTCKQYSP